MPLAAERMDKMGLDERQKALDAAIAKIQKDYGQGSIMKLSLIHILAEGFVNLQAHIENLQKYHVPVVVTLNSFLSDT